MLTCNICKYAGRPIYKSPCSECKDFSKYEYENKKTNADRIRAMSDDELKEFICSILQCKFCKFEGFGGCELLKWLQQPAEGE